MTDIAATLNAYLVFRFGITLERIIANATADVCSLALRGAVEIACDPVGRYEYPDSGVSELYQGLIEIEGLLYRFRCSVFVDAGGSRFVESIGELEVLRWGVKLLVPG